LLFFLCHVDNLFGKCQSHVGGDVIDNYQYHLTGAQLSELYRIVQRLVADGYTWRHRHTQCALSAALSRYRYGSVVDSIQTMCADSYLQEGQFEADLINSSQHGGMQGMSPNMRTHLSGNYNKAFNEFQKFMQGLQAEDLFALKHFLIMDSSYKQPVSVKTVTEPAKPSKVPNAEDFLGTFF